MQAVSPPRTGTRLANPVPSQDSSPAPVAAAASSSAGAVDDAFPLVPRAPASATGGGRDIPPSAGTVGSLHGTTRLLYSSDGRYRPDTSRSTDSLPAAGGGAAGLGGGTGAGGVSQRGEKDGSTGEGAGLGEVGSLKKELDRRALALQTAGAEIVKLRRKIELLVEAAAAERARTVAAGRVKAQEDALLLQTVLQDVHTATRSAATSMAAPGDMLSAASSTLLSLLRAGEGERDTYREGERAWAIGVAGDSTGYSEERQQPHRSIEEQMARRLLLLARHYSEVKQGNAALMRELQAARVRAEIAEGAVRQQQAAGGGERLALSLTASAQRDGAKEGLDGTAAQGFSSAVPRATSALLLAPQHTGRYMQALLEGVDGLDPTGTVSSFTHAKLLDAYEGLQGEKEEVVARAAALTVQLGQVREAYALAQRRMIGLQEKRQKESSDSHAPCRGESEALRDMLSQSHTLVQRLEGELDRCRAKLAAERDKVALLEGKVEAGKEVTQRLVEELQHRIRSIGSNRTGGGGGGVAGGTALLNSTAMAGSVGAALARTNRAVGATPVVQADGPSSVHVTAAAPG